MATDACCLTKISAEGCWSTIKGSQYITSGRLRCAIRIDYSQTGAISIGLARPDTPIGDVVPGSPIVFLPYMWMPDHRMTFQQNLPTRDEPFGEPLRMGDVITLDLDLNSGTLTVGRAHESFGVAFKMLQGPVAPALSLCSVGDRVTLVGWGGMPAFGTSITPAVHGVAAPAATEPPPCYLPIEDSYPGMRHLCRDPPILAIDNFLSEQECRDMIAQGARFLGRSAVVGGQLSISRTSSTCYVDREKCPDFIRKAMHLLRKPAEHFELPQIAHYQRTQEYKTHLDAFDLSTAAGQQAVRNGGQRVATLLVYLNDVADGGCTYFTTLDLRVKPTVGMALVFFPCFVDGRIDRRLLHTGEPAVDEKWLAQLWIRQSNFYGVSSETQLMQQRALAAAAAGGRGDEDGGDDDDEDGEDGGDDNDGDAGDEGEDVPPPSGGGAGPTLRDSAASCGPSASARLSEATLPPAA